MNTNIIDEINKQREVTSEQEKIFDAQKSKLRELEDVYINEHLIKFGGVEGITDKLRQIMESYVDITDLSDNDTGIQSDSSIIDVETELSSHNNIYLKINLSRYHSVHRKVYYDATISLDEYQEIVIAYEDMLYFV